MALHKIIITQQGVQKRCSQVWLSKMNQPKFVNQNLFIMVRKAVGVILTTPPTIHAPPCPPPCPHRLVPNQTVANLPIFNLWAIFNSLVGYFEKKDSHFENKFLVLKLALHYISPRLVYIFSLQDEACFLKAFFNPFFFFYND